MMLGSLQIAVRSFASTINRTHSMVSTARCPAEDVRLMFEHFIIISGGHSNLFTYCSIASGREKALIGMKGSPLGFGTDIVILSESYVRRLFILAYQGGSIRMRLCCTSRRLPGRFRSVLTKSILTR